MIVVTRPFTPQDIVGGHPALDLVNTVTSWDVAPAKDWLDGYARLVEWARLAGIADPATLDLLSERAAAAPQEAEKALERIKGFREALYSAYAALIAGETPEIEAIESVWKEARSRQRLARHDHGVQALLAVESSGLDLIRDWIAGPAVELLCRLPNDRARLCRGHHCGWLFLDSSKGGQRVWCDMATCGNAAKSRKLVESRKTSRG
jgi:predicted RNA-binding Zn ribbon-like protein